MSRTLDLGHLCLYAPKENLQLTSQGTITASLQNSASTDLITLSSILTERSGWVRRGQGLHLALEICVGGKPLDCQQSHRVANSICTAELWKQLQLQPTLPALPLDSREELHSIRINLVHSDIECASQEKSRHRLATGACIADVQPPDGVPVVLLEQVKLKIDISNTPQRKFQRKKERFITQQPKNSQPFVSEAPESDIDLICMDDIRDEEDFEIVSHDSFLLDLPDDYTMPDASEIVENGRSWASTSKPTRVDSGISMESRNEQKDEALSSDTVVSLVNTVLYFSICEKAPKQKGGIKVKSDEMKMKLASAAPTLWSPGFLKNISEHAPFVPPIANTLSNPLLMQAKSTSLRTKLANLHMLGHPASCSTSPTKDALPSSQGTSFRSVSVNMWELLQRELYDPGAARRIRPLNTENLHIVGTSDDDDLLPEFWNESLIDGNEDSRFEDLEIADSDYEAFWGIEHDDEVDGFGILHDPDFSDDMIIDSTYNIPLQAIFATSEHEDDTLPGMLHDSSDFNGSFEEKDFEHLF